MVMQREVAEGSIACCAILARHFGHGVDLPWMRQRFGASVKGVSLVPDDVSVLVEIFERGWRCGFNQKFRTVSVEQGCLVRLVYLTENRMKHAYPRMAP
jgi:hypothetical protein